MPADLTLRDKEAAASYAMHALFQGRRVLTDRGLSILGPRFIKDSSRVYFTNRLGISDAVFLRQGLKPIPSDRNLNVDNGDVIISFSNEDALGNPCHNIQFACIFGSMGAEFWEIRIYRSLLLKHYFFFLTCQS